MSYRKEFGRMARPLSNNFTGDEKQVKHGLQDTFGVTIKNADTSVSKKVALLSGHFDTDAFTYDSTKGVLVFKSNPAELNAAGLPCDAVIDDGVCLDSKVTCTPLDSSKTIRNFRKFIMTNPRELKGVTIISSNTAAFNSSLVVSSSTPFSKCGEKDIQLASFFSPNQYQNDRIEIDFTENELEFSDLCVLIANIPAGATMTFILRF